MGSHLGKRFSMETMIERQARDRDAQKGNAFALLELGHQMIAIRGHGSISLR